MRVRVREREVDPRSGAVPTAIAALVGSGLRPPPSAGRSAGAKAAVPSRGWNAHAGNEARRICGLEEDVVIARAGAVVSTWTQSGS
jgi:hypothetical protein